MCRKLIPKISVATDIGKYGRIRCTTAVPAKATCCVCVGCSGLWVVIWWLLSLLFPFESFYFILVRSPSFQIELVWKSALKTHQSIWSTFGFNISCILNIQQPTKRDSIFNSHECFFWGGRGRFFVRKTWMHLIKWIYFLHWTVNNGKLFNQRHRLPNFCCIFFSFFPQTPLQMRLIYT